MRWPHFCVMESSTPCSCNHISHNLPSCLTIVHEQFCFGKKISGTQVHSVSGCSKFFFSFFLWHLCPVHWPHLTFSTTQIGQTNWIFFFLGGIKYVDNTSLLQKQKNAPISCYHKFHVYRNSKGKVNVTLPHLSRKIKSLFYLTNVQFEHLPEKLISILHNQHFWADIMHDKRDSVVLMTLKKEQIHHISSKH